MDIYIRLIEGATLRDAALEIQQLNVAFADKLVNGPIKCNPDSYREEPVLDADGNPVLDQDGNATTQQVEVPEGFIGDANTIPNDAGIVTVRITNYESFEWWTMPSSFVVVSGYPRRGDDNSILPGAFI